MGIFGDLQAPFRRRSSRPTTRERLMDMLKAAGYPVEFISGAKGYYRINAHYDDTIVCWEAHSGNYHIVSYCTMTNCVRYGFTFLQDGWLLEVVAKSPSARTDVR